MKKTTIILILLATKISVAQNLTDFIPQNAQYVVGLNLAQLEAKSNQMDYSQFLSPLIKSSNNYWNNGDESCEIISVKSLFKTPADYGVDLNENFYFFPTSINKISGSMYLFKLANAKIFDEKLIKTCTNAKNISTTYVGNAIIYSTKNLSVSINGNIGMIFVKQYNYLEDYSDVATTVEPAYEGVYDSTATSTIDEMYDMPPPPPPAEDASEIMIEQLGDYEGTEVGVEHGYDEEDISEKTIKKTENKEKKIKEKPLTAKQKAEIARIEEEEALEMAIQDSIYKVEQQKEREERQRIEDEKTKIKLDNISNFMQQFLTKNANNITNNRNLQYLLNQKNDAFAYYNGGSNLMNTYSKLFEQMHWRNNEDNKTITSPLLNDINNTLALNFNNGKVDVVLKNLYTKTTYNYIKEIHDNKFNKNLLKYIDGKNLLGIMSLNTNMEASANYYGAMYKEVLTSISGGNDYTNYILPSAEIAYAFIDKEMLLKTLSGQMVIACTGFDEIKTKYTTYEYDENYQSKEVLKESIEKQPKIVMAMAVGEYENALKLFNIIKKYKFINKIKDNVISFYGPSYSHLNVYAALTKDALIITNDANLVSNNLEGYKGDNALSKNIIKDLKGHSLYCKVYSKSLMQQIKDNYMKGDAPSEFNKIFAQMGNFQLTDSKPTANDYTINASLDLNDSNINALETLLKMMAR